MAHHKAGTTRRRGRAALGALVAIAGLPLAAPGPAEAAGEAGRWTASAPLTEGRYAHTATRLADDTVLVAGGKTDGGTTDTAEVYKLATGKWTNVGPLNVGRALHTATALDNGKVVVAGGFGAGGEPIALTEVYEPSPTRLGGSFGPTPHPTLNRPTPQPSLMNEARGMHSATKLSDGRVLVTGGVVLTPSTSNALPLVRLTASTKSAEIYNPADGKWTTVAQMKEARQGHTSTLIRWPTDPDPGHRTRVLVTGGWAEPTPPNQGIKQLKTAALYNPHLNKWEDTGSMVSDHADATEPENFVIGRAGHVATYIDVDNTVLLVGAMSPTKKAERYYPPADGVEANGVFEATGDLFTARGGSFLMRHGSGVTATFIPCDPGCGKVLVVGGGAGRSTELYDPTLETWVTTETMDVLTAREAGHSATILETGQVLVAGGRSGGGATKSSELYFPRAGVSATPDLKVENTSTAELERDATRQFRVSLSAPQLEPVTVRYATQDVSATATSSSNPEGDYVPARGAVVIPSGALSQTVTVAVLPDLDYEGDEQFSLQLSEATSAVISVGQATASIKNDDELPATQVSISGPPDAQDEKDAGLVAHEFTVTLEILDPTKPRKVVTVEYSTSLPMESGDVGQAGTVVFSGGSDPLVKTIRIYSQGDGYPEPDESFSVTLSGQPTNTRIAPGKGRAFATIRNDDGSLPSITVADDLRVPETDTATAAIFAVTLQAPTKVPVTVRYGTRDGTALGWASLNTYHQDPNDLHHPRNRDYWHMPDPDLLENDRLVFPPSGAASQTQFVTVPIFGDRDKEGDEDFYLHLETQDGVLVKAFGKATIVNND